MCMGRNRITADPWQVWVNKYGKRGDNLERRKEKRRSEHKSVRRSSREVEVLGGIEKGEHDRAVQVGDVKRGKPRKFDQGDAEYMKQFYEDLCKSMKKGQALSMTAYKFQCSTQTVRKVLNGKYWLKRLNNNERYG